MISGWADEAMIEFSHPLTDIVRTAFWLDSFLSDRNEDLIAARQALQA